MATADKRYNDLNTYLRNRFGCRVQKITVDAGLTCPNRDGIISAEGCIFCNDRGSGTGAHDRGLSITRQLEQGKAALSKRYKAKKFLAYFQSFSNTYAPVETLRRLYEEAMGVDGIVGISIGTRPDCIDRDKLALLQELAGKCLVWVEYGLQSSHDSSLSLINRGHDAACFARAVEKTQNRGIQVCAHVILGLPGETTAHVHDTAKFISRPGIQGVKLHLLYVIKGTRLETMYRQGSYRCLTQTAYIDLVCDFLERIPADMIVQRLTSDPHPHELVAPRWSLNKTETLSMIHAELERRDTRQGKLAR
jgi:radical SAM protein (TIGR01212 family)